VGNFVQKMNQERTQQEDPALQCTQMLDKQIHEYVPENQSMHFHHFLSMSCLLFDTDHQSSFIIDYCLNNKNDEAVREAIEWAANNGLYELVSSLAELYPSCFSDLYLLCLKKKNAEISPVQLYNELEKMKFRLGKEAEVPEVLVLVKIMSLYSFLSLHSYGLILPVAAEAFNEAEFIKNSYIKESYMIRIKEIMAIYYTKQSHLQDAISIAQETINLENFRKFPFFVNSMLHLLAEIYVYDDYNKSIYYIEKAIEHFKEIGSSERFLDYEHALYATHDFIKITNGMHQNLYLTDKAEKAHYLARQPDAFSKERALYLLEEIAKENGKLSPFHLCYKALALGDLRLMKFAETEFLKNGELFHVRLPRRYLKAMEQ
jgi:hypothetical protein